MNAILFLSVFVGTLAAVWGYPALCSQRSAYGKGYARRWLTWVPLANLYQLRPIAQTSRSALLSLALALAALLASVAGMSVVLARMHLPFNVSVPIVLAALWLIGVTACLTALRWTFTSFERQFWAAVLLLIAASGIAYLGLARIWVDWLQTINGGAQCRLDTRWAFAGLLFLNAVTLARTLWRRWRKAQTAPPNGGPVMRPGDSGASGWPPPVS
jgi:hypothetical protein